MLNKFKWKNLDCVWDPYTYILITWKSLSFCWENRTASLVFDNDIALFRQKLGKTLINNGSQYIIITWKNGSVNYAFFPFSLSLSFTHSLPIKPHESEITRVWLFVTPWTVAHQAPQSTGFSRQEYWSGLPFPSPGDLPNPGIEPGSSALQADALLSEPPGKPIKPHSGHLILTWLNC